MTNQTPPPTDASDLLKKMAELEAQVAAANKRASDAEAAAKRRPAPVAPAAPAGPPNKLQELQDYANQVTQRLQVLETAQKFGLKPEELEGDYQSPQELQLAAQVKALQKQVSESHQTGQQANDLLAKVSQQLDELKSQQAELMPDTGGRTGNSEARQKRLTELRDQAQKLGYTPQARYVLLQSIYEDPTKRMSLHPKDREESGPPQK